MLTHHPVKGSYTVTQGFGPANWNAVYEIHNGMDFVGIPKYEFTVLAARAGEVITAGPDLNKDPKWKGGFGTHVIIDHGAIAGVRVVTLYAHLRTALVKLGQRVNGGQEIGIADSTGYSIGPHLHFGVKVKGVWVDPGPLLAALSPVTDASSTSKSVKIIGKDGVNMRLGPGMTGTVIGELFKNTQIDYVTTVVKDGIEWFELDMPKVYVAKSTLNGTELARANG